MWMDHRAKKEASEINDTKLPILTYVGGQVSLEMEMPKLKWIKANWPNVWRQAEDFFDLADYLTFRMTGSRSRSLCTVVCKWNYRGHADPHGPEGWDAGFLKAIGLQDLADNDYKRIGNQILKYIFCLISRVFLI